MIITKELIDKISVLPYPISINEFKDIIISLNGGGSIQAICIAINCFCRTNGYNFRLSYNLKTRLVKQVDEAESRELFD